MGLRVPKCSYNKTPVVLKPYQIPPPGVWSVPRAALFRQQAVTGSMFLLLYWGYSICGVMLFPKTWHLAGSLSKCLVSWQWCLFLNCLIPAGMALEELFVSKLLHDWVSLGERWAVLVVHCGHCLFLYKEKKTLATLFYTKKILLD